MMMRRSTNTKISLKRIILRRKICVNNDDDPSDDEDNDSSIEDKLNDFMLMAMGDFDDEHTGGEMDDEEVVVDMCWQPIHIFFMIL